MATKTDFTEEEWARLKRSPFVAGLAISLADPGGPIEAFKETNATVKTVLGAAESGDHGELVREIARDVKAETQHRKNPLSGYKPGKGANMGVEITDELAAVNRLVTEKAPDDAADFREWLLQAAQNAANAAKEGGFMGFKAERVSEGEQQMLDKLRGVLA
jgi:hypothetical protein